MPLTTAGSIVSLALKAAGILGIGQNPNPEDTNDCFDVLNGMTAMWSKKRWLVYHLLDIGIPTTGAMSYTVGVGQDFNTAARVDRLEAAFFRQFVSGIPGQTYVDYPLGILESREDYNEIALKQLRSWPEFIFFDSGYPIGNVYPIPIPLQNGTFELHITIKDILPQFANLTSAVNLPDEYKEALWTNLTVRVCAIYPGAVLTPVVEGLAKASLSTIRMANTQIPRLDLPAQLIRPSLFNIYSYQQY